MSSSSFTPILCIVGFHHARGPEVEQWIGPSETEQKGYENEWPLLSFLALADGAHSFAEQVSYFTVRKQVSDAHSTSLFGIACTRHIDSRELLNKAPDVTRSTVQKAVVLIGDRPQQFGQWRERLSFVTRAWFDQKDFDDIAILEDFQISLAQKPHPQAQPELDRDQYFGLSLREMIRAFKHNVLVLFKSLLLQPRMLFYGSNCERLCMMQFSLISLIPNLINFLHDCAHPSLNSREAAMLMPTSLKTSQRASLLAYVGLPLHLFGSGSFFGPYTPLQQLNMFTDHSTRSYLAGSTNQLILSQQERYADVFVDMDQSSVTINSQTLTRALTLTLADRRFIDSLVQIVNDTWDPLNPSRPNTLGFAGSEEYIRLQFEEYLLALLSVVKLHLLLAQKNDEQIRNTLIGNIRSDPSSSSTTNDPTADFGSDWVHTWQSTDAFRLFDKFTDPHLFDLIDSAHPCAGQPQQLSLEDVQRRLASQVAHLHLDQHLANSRDAIGKGLATGQKKVTEAWSAIWREETIGYNSNDDARDGAERSKLQKQAQEQKPSSAPISVSNHSYSQAQAQASAYLSSWGAWAAEKKKKVGWTSTDNITFLEQGEKEKELAESAVDVAAMNSEDELEELSRK